MSHWIDNFVYFGVPTIEQEKEILENILDENGQLDFKILLPDCKLFHDIFYPTEVFWKNGVLVVYFETKWVPPIDWFIALFQKLRIPFTVEWTDDAVTSGDNSEGKFSDEYTRHREWFHFFDDKPTLTRKTLYCSIDEWVKL